MDYTWCNLCELYCVRTLQDRGGGLYVRCKSFPPKTKNCLNCNLPSTYSSRSYLPSFCVYLSVSFRSMIPQYIVLWDLLFGLKSGPNEDVTYISEHIIPRETNFSSEAVLAAV
jgi:hypothetical protein